MSTLFDIETTTQQFDLSHGFLPQQDPLDELPPAFKAWEDLALELPKLLMSNQTRQIIERLPTFDTTELRTPEQLERAMLILSYLGHAYVWNQADPTNHLPAVLAQPWYAIANKIGRPPVLSYASYALYNWRRLDKNKPIALGNIALLQNFLGGADEEWFILIHVDIEAHAAPGLNAIVPAQQAANANDNTALLQHLSTARNSLETITDTLKRMPEYCDPYIYYNRVRPYIHGWKDNPALPNGMLYEGVEAYDNKPQFFKGETGAQSTIIPCFDGLLAVEHENNPLKAHLNEMRIYMPPQHRQFLEFVEQGPSIRNHIAQQSQAELREVYNDCIRWVSEFRQTHLNYAAQYIQKQSQSSTANPTEVGTGGTPFMKYLSKHLKETDQFLL